VLALNDYRPARACRLPPSEIDTIVPAGCERSQLDALGRFEKIAH
jgi:hypothetical protein